jgi:DNA-binding SARP family transcriptional activator/predicted ATPase
MTTLRISVLGSLQIHKGDQPLSRFESNKVRALLAYLAVESHTPHSRESLVELLWPESPTDSSLGNLRYALADLRRVIGDASAQPRYLLISRDRLQFNASSDHELDSAALASLLGDGGIENQKRAIALYHGDFLAGFPSVNSNPLEEWITLKREQFRRMVIEALRAVTEHHQQRGEYKLALPFAHRQVELEPWLEEAHQQVMRLLAFDGQRGAALAQFEICRNALARELEVEPSAETVRLYESIRDGGLGSPPPPRSEYDLLLRSLADGRRSAPDGSSVTAETILASLSAGRSAAQKFAYEEALTQYHHGLNLLNSLPDSPEKLELELQIQIAMGAALLSVRNYSNPEVVRAYQRAYKICRDLGAHAELFHALKALSSYYALCGDIHAGLDIGERLMKIAEESQDDAQLVIAHNNRGISLLFAGEFAAYQSHARKLLELYDETRHHHLASVIGYDPKVATLSHSIGLWMLGYPDQALECIQQAMAWADKIQHPFSQCYAQFFLAYIHLLRREISPVLEHAEKLIFRSKQICNSFWFAQGLIVKGWAEAHSGKIEDGLQILLQGFSIIRGAGSMFVLCSSAAWLCEACGMVGKAEEGLSMLDEYISQSIGAGNLHMMSANYICRGELLLKLNKPEEAEASFEEAIEIARQQQAKGWELRAAMSLSHLWIQQGKMETARSTLHEIVNWFTEGLDTADFLEAQALLEELNRQPVVRM